MFLIGRIKTYLAAAGAVLGAILFAYLRGKRDSIHEYEREADQDLIEKMRISKGVRDEITQLPDDHFVDRARNWVRKDNE